MIDPAAVAPFAALVLRDLAGVPRLSRWRLDCDRPAPARECDVLFSCCRLPHDPARYSRRVALAFGVGRRSW